MHDFQFSDAQAFTTLVDSTGIVSTNVFNMELTKLAGDTILTNDQLVGVVNITIPPLATQTAAEGLDIDLLSNDDDDMTTGTEIKLGTVHVTLLELIAGCVKNIEVTASLTQSFVGLWYKATSTTLDTGQTVDAHFSIAPLTENDKLQKVPSRS